MLNLRRQSCENGVQLSNHKFVDVFLRCLSDVEHSARTAEIKLSLICGDFDDSCPWVMVSEAPRNQLSNPWWELKRGSRASWRRFLKEITTNKELPHNKGL